MPRRKRIKAKPNIVGSFLDDDRRLKEIEIIDGISEHFGKGSNRKLVHLRNFNDALNLAASSYFFGTKRARDKFKRLIYGKRNKTALVREFQLSGIQIGERKGRDLAAKIQIAIKAFDNALKTQKGNS